MKTKEEILNQLYITAEDLTILIPTMNYQKALGYIKQTQEEMKEKNLFIPETKTKLALTKLIRKKFGF